YQASPKESYFIVVKRICRYLKGTPNLGLWKSTSRGCQIPVGKLVCWSAKKQSSVAMSSAEAEYVAAAGCCTKKGREPNVCYTRLLSLIIKHLLGNAYKNNKLKPFKPHHISSTSFKTPSANEEVNAGNTIDKSLSRTTIKPVGQPKASTNKRSKKKKDPSSSEPKTSKNVRQSQSKKQVAKTQHAEESVPLLMLLKVYWPPNR
ncbi:retrovirus-related pol polyprotein from transposon TNT 1-94, partial [Tanacetum coccineum]